MPVEMNLDRLRFVDGPPAHVRLGQPVVASVGLADDMLREIVPTAPLYLSMLISAHGSLAVGSRAQAPTPLATPVGKATGGLEDAFDAMACFEEIEYDENGKQVSGPTYIQSPWFDQCS